MGQSEIQSLRRLYADAFSELEIMFNLGQLVSLPLQVAVVEQPIAFFGVLGMEADAAGGMGKKGKETAFEMTLQIQYAVEPGSRQSAAKLPDPLPPSGPVKDDDLIYSGMLSDDIRPFRLNQPGDGALREVLFDGRDQAQPPGHITECTHKDDQDGRFWRQVDDPWLLSSRRACLEKVVRRLCCVPGRGIVHVRGSDRYISHTGKGFFAVI